MTAARVMILITTIIGRLFSSIIDLLSASVGTPEEHRTRHLVRGFSLLARVPSSAAAMHRLGTTRSDRSRSESQPELAFLKLPSREGLSK